MALGIAGEIIAGNNEELIAGLCENGSCGVRTNNATHQRGSAGARQATDDSILSVAGGDAIVHTSTIKTGR